MNNRTRVYWHTSATDRNTASRVTYTRNLGWLLRNAAYATVQTLYRFPSDTGDIARLAVEGTRNGQNFTFVCDFASYDVAARWVARPCLRHTAIVR